MQAKSAGKRMWRRIDTPGLEVLRWSTVTDGHVVLSDLTVAEDGGYHARWRWELDERWRSRRLEVVVRGGEERVRTIERAGETSWKVDGQPRADLDGCVEIDLSITPFCNGLALHAIDGAGFISVAYVLAPELTVTASRQEYQRLDARRVRFIDHGAVKGFTAVLELDDESLVSRYEGLFERVADGSA
jgi:hypothetical protein